MTFQINSNYLEKYARDYAAKVCEGYFSSKQFITGNDIINLTNSSQVNFFVIKRLFELWQEELAKLKSNPFFDYRDIAVHEALTQFMNVLSRRIKVERANLEPLLETAVSQAVFLATDPVAYYQSEIANAPSGKINDYLRENKKYYKWHDKVVGFLIDKAGFGHDEGAYLRAIAANYQAIQDSLESVNLLLATLGDIKAFDLDAYQQKDSAIAPNEIGSGTGNIQEEKSSFFDQVGIENLTQTKEIKASPLSEPDQTMITAAEVQSRPKAGSASNLNSSRIKSRFATESYRGMKGVIGELSESLAINQRFMFTKELFDGNADLLRHALKSIDQCNSFDEALDLINERYVEELGWQIDAEPVQEFLLLVFRKFEV